MAAYWVNSNSSLVVLILLLTVVSCVGATGAYTNSPYDALNNDPSNLIKNLPDDEHFTASFSVLQHLHIKDGLINLPVIILEMLLRLVSLLKLRKKLRSYIGSSEAVTIVKELDYVLSAAYEGIEAANGKHEDKPFDRVIKRLSNFRARLQVPNREQKGQPEVLDDISIALKEFEDISQFKVNLIRNTTFMGTGTKGPSTNSDTAHQKSPNGQCRLGNVSNFAKESSYDNSTLSQLWNDLFERSVDAVSKGVPSGMYRDEQCSSTKTPGPNSFPQLNEDPACSNDESDQEIQSYKSGILLDNDIVDQNQRFLENAEPAQTKLSVSDSSRAHLNATSSQPDTNVPLLNMNISELGTNESQLNSEETQLDASNLHLHRYAPELDIKAPEPDLNVTQLNTCESKPNSKKNQPHTTGTQLDTNNTHPHSPAPDPDTKVSLLNTTVSQKNTNESQINSTEKQAHTTGTQLDAFSSHLCRNVPLSDSKVPLANNNISQLNTSESQPDPEETQLDANSSHLIGDTPGPDTKASPSEINVSQLKTCDSEPNTKEKQPATTGTQLDTNCSHLHSNVPCSNTKVTLLDMTVSQPNTVETQPDNKETQTIATGTQLDAKCLHLCSDVPLSDTEVPLSDANISEANTNESQPDTEETLLDTNSSNSLTKAPQLDTNVPQGDSNLPLPGTNVPQPKADESEPDASETQLDTNSPPDTHDLPRTFDDDVHDTYKLHHQCLPGILIANDLPTSGDVVIDHGNLGTLDHREPFADHPQSSTREHSIHSSIQLNDFSVFSDNSYTSNTSTESLYHSDLLRDEKEQNSTNTTSRACPIIQTDHHNCNDQAHNVDHCRIRDSDPVSNRHSTAQCPDNADDQVGSSYSGHLLLHSLTPNSLGQTNDFSRFSTEDSHSDILHPALQTFESDNEETSNSKSQLVSPTRSCSPGSSGIVSLPQSDELTQLVSNLPGIASTFSLQSLPRHASCSSSDSRQGEVDEESETSSLVLWSPTNDTLEDFYLLEDQQPSSMKLDQNWLGHSNNSISDDDVFVDTVGEVRVDSLTKEILRNRDRIPEAFNASAPMLTVNIVSYESIEKFLEAPDKPDLTTQEGRLLSFLNANVLLPATDLAQAGFSSSSLLEYKKKSAVFCFRCLLQLDNLNAKLNAMALHKTFGENCPFMIDISMPGMHLETDTDVNHEIVVNDLVVQTPDASATPTPSEIYKHYNTLQLSLAKLKGADGESHEDLMKLAAQITRPLVTPTNDFREFGVMSDKPKHPNMALESNRKETMKTYHNTHLVDPKAANTAGFFWSGRGDQMICFSCGIEHSDWTADTAPLKRHMVLSPKCTFLLSMYNQEYIDQTIANEPAYTPPPRQVKIESVPVRSVKPRNEVPLAANIRENSSLFFDGDPPPKRLVEKTWEVIEERIKYGEPDYTRECDLVKDLLEKEKALNEITAEPPEDPLRFVNRSSIEESDVNRIQPKRRAQVTDEGPKPKVSQRASTTNRRKEPEPLDLDPAVLVSSARCQICLDEPKEIMFVPCTHLATCTKCGLTQPQCPVCRRDVKGTVRVSI